MKLQFESIRSFLLLAIILFSSGLLPAQTPAGYSISGTVIDSVTQKPVNYITVSLKSNTTRVINTMLTKADGIFRFEKITAGNYTITLASMGYTPREIPVELSNRLVQTVNLGNLIITRQNRQLQQVTITASKPLIKHEIDRISYDLQADPESKGSSMLEIMRKVPLLSVDGEDNVLLNGNKSYKILINGRPSSMMERNAKDILRSMPASSIKNIEVIFNPSSRYDAEGIAGLINIITDKKVDNGYNGSLNVNEKFPVGGPAAGGTFTFKQGKFGMSTTGGAALYHSPAVFALNSRTTSGAAATLLDQHSIRQSDSKTRYISADLSYEPDSLNLISGQFNVNGSRSSGLVNQASLLSNESGTMQAYNLDNISTGSGSGMDASLNYQRGFKSIKARLLTFSYRHVAFRNDLFSSQNISNPVNYVNPDYNQTNEGSATEQTFQADYVQTVKNLNMEAGIKGIFRVNTSDFQFLSFNPASGFFDRDPALSNTFNNQQNVFAAYNSYVYKLKDWGFRAGLRIEQTVIDADFIAASPQLKKNYLNVIPTATISRMLKNKGRLGLNYTSRLQRPGIYQLNPFVDRSNPNFETSGNPDLKPTRTNIIQLDYNRSQKVTVSATVAYMFFNSLIFPVSVYDPATNITRSTYEDDSQGDILRSNLYISYPVSKKMNITLNGDIRYVWASVLVNGVMVKNELFNTHLHVSTGYRFDKGWRLNGNLTMLGRSLSTTQVRTNAYTTFSLGANKDVVKDKLTFSATLNNPFTKYRRNLEETIGPDFLQLNDSRSYFRTFSASLNYRFGKLKGEIRKNKRRIVNDDVVNGK